MKGTPLFQRQDLLRHAHLLISKDNFTREDSARVTALMDLAERIGEGGPETRSDGAESSALDHFLRATSKYEAKYRTLGIGSPTQSTPTSVLAHQGFWDRLTRALKAFDALFDSSVCTIVETDTGAPMVLPSLDDTGNAAEPITETTEEQPEADPIMAAIMSIPPTYRTGAITVSLELLQDAGFPISDVLSAAMAIRLARGIGPNLVSALLGSAVIGATAVGSSANSGGSETGANSIGWVDLVSLVRSVDPAYRATEKVNWLMNSDTLLSIDSVINKNGQPMIHPVYDAQGRRILLGYPVAICPSMPDIGASNTPVAFGATGYFVTRTVKATTRLQTYYEQYITQGKIGFRTFMRANGQLMAVSSGCESPYSPAQSPVKLLANAS